MISDIDIYRTANILVKMHGEDAPLHAAMKADEYQDAGNSDGKQLWMKLLKAVEVLLDKTPPKTVH